MQGYLYTQTHWLGKGDTAKEWTGKDVMLKAQGTGDSSFQNRKYSQNPAKYTDETIHTHNKIKVNFRGWKSKQVSKSMITHNLSHKNMTVAEVFTR